jgi:hypothetical protein
MGKETEDKEEETEGEDINEQINSEPAGANPAAGAAPGAEMAAPPMMAAASNWVKTAALRFDIHITDPRNFINKGRKLASKGTYVPGPIGLVCPQCASRKVAFENSEGTCAACGCLTHVAIKNTGKGTAIAELTVQPNLMLGREEKIYEDGSKGGYAITADCENCDEIRQSLHRILSSRKSLSKVAIATQNTNSMLACMSDQAGNGYGEDDSMEICATIKDYFYKKALIEEDDEEAEEVEDAFGETKDDTTSEDTSETEEDKVEFEEEEGEEDDQTEFEAEESEEEESGEKNITDAVGDIEEVTGVTIDFVDGTGNEGQISLEVDAPDKTEDTELPEDGEVVEIEEEEDFTPEEVSELDNEEEMDESDILGSLFSDGTSMGMEEENPIASTGTMISSSEAKELAKKTSELLRGGRVASSNRAGGSNIDIAKIAQALHMPLDTEADVPRDEEVGIVDEGGTEKYLNEHENEAKEIKGTAAGSSLSKEDVTQGSDRGVEVIKPKKQSTSQNKTKKADIKIKQPESGVDWGETENDNEKVLQDALSGMGFSPKRINSIMAEIEKMKKGSEENIDESLDDVLMRSPIDPIPSEDFVEDDDQALTANLKVTVKKAQQSTNKNEPVDGVQTKKDLDVPRNKEKAKPEIDVNRPDVDSPEEVRINEYKLGPDATNLHNDKIVPRDGSGDGVGGKKPKFDQESGDKQTSGNPDKYVQELQDKNKITPTPAGNEENHATTGVNTASEKVDMKKAAIKKVAQAKGLDENKLEAIEEDDVIMVLDPDTDIVYTVK